MSTALTKQDTRAVASGQTVRPDDSAKGAIRAGWIIILVFFGAFGVWGSMAPLNAAVMGDAVVKVEGNRKSIAHVDGGKVKEVRVREGDRVKAGDVVIVLDDTEYRAQVAMLDDQRTQLMAVEARLRSEFSGLSEISFPAELTDRQADPMVKSTLQDQVSEFETRREALLGNKAVLEQRIAQYRARIDGLIGQMDPLDEQLASIAEERDSLVELLKEGLTTRTRVLDLDRRVSTIIGQKIEMESNINASQEAIAELSQQISQLQKDQSEKIAADLRDVRTKLADVTLRLAAVRAALEQTEIRTPYSGKVVDLAVFSIGAVIGRGERLLDIVPENTILDVEVKIRVEDIADVRPGMTAEVHFTSYKQRVTPLIHGIIAEISADRLTDERTQVPYYAARVDVDAAELAASPEINLYPGMPATVMITTKERTALDYLLGPLISSFDRSFRER